MCIIIMKVLLSAGSGLVWCILVMFFCMCIEHIFLKKEHKPRLTGKEIILIKEVLAGNISLPLVANDGLFVECVDRIENIFERFIDKSKEQIEYLDSVSRRISIDAVPPLNENVILDMGEELKSGYTFEELLDIRYPETTEEKKERLLTSPISIIEMPGIGLNIFQRQFRCETVQDILLIMVTYHSRKTMLGISRLGLESVHALELFMVREGLISVVDGVYSSEY